VFKFVSTIDSGGDRIAMIDKMYELDDTILAGEYDSIRSVIDILSGRGLPVGVLLSLLTVTLPRKLEIGEPRKRLYEMVSTIAPEAVCGLE